MNMTKAEITLSTTHDGQTFDAKYPLDLDNAEADLIKLQEKFALHVEWCMANVATADTDAEEEPCPKCNRNMAVNEIIADDMVIAVYHYCKYCREE